MPCYRKSDKIPLLEQDKIKNKLKELVKEYKVKENVVIKFNSSQPDTYVYIPDKDTYIINYKKFDDNHSNRYDIYTYFYFLLENRNYDYSHFYKNELRKELDILIKKYNIKEKVNLKFVELNEDVNADFTFYRIDNVGEIRINEKHLTKRNFKSLVMSLEHEFCHLLVYKQNKKLELELNKLKHMSHKKEVTYLLKYLRFLKFDDHGRMFNKTLRKFGQENYKVEPISYNIALDGISIWN